MFRRRYYGRRRFSSFGRGRPYGGYRSRSRSYLPRRPRFASRRVRFGGRRW